MPEETYDALILGAGQSGDPLRGRWPGPESGSRWWSRDAVGGTCVNRGCTPTKTMAASARVAYLARRGADFGVETGPVTVNLTKVRQRKRDIVDSFRGGTEQKLEHTDGVELIYGDAKFIGPKTVEAALNNHGGTRTLAAPLVFINAGARPTVPPIDGLSEIEFLDSTSILELAAVPEHLVVLGGSYIALEFGQMFRRFGSRVTIIEQSGRILGREDGDVSEEMTKILTEDGIDIQTGTKAVRAEKAGGGVTLTLHTPSGEKTVSGSHLLVAVGRTPNTDTLGLGAAGIAADTHGYITVGDTLETSVRASTPSAMSKAARRSRISPTTIFGSSKPICWTAAGAKFPTGPYRIRSSPTRSSAGSG